MKYKVLTIWQIMQPLYIYIYIKLMDLSYFCTSSMMFKNLKKKNYEEITSKPGLLCLAPCCNVWLHHHICFTVSIEIPFVPQFIINLMLFLLYAKITKNLLTSVKIYKFVKNLDFDFFSPHQIGSGLLISAFLKIFLKYREDF